MRCSKSKQDRDNIAFWCILLLLLCDGQLKSLYKNEQGDRKCDNPFFACRFLISCSPPAVTSLSGEIFFLSPLISLARRARERVAQMLMHFLQPGFRLVSRPFPSHSHLSILWGKRA